MLLPAVTVTPCGTVCVPAVLPSCPLPSAACCSCWCVVTPADTAASLPPCCEAAAALSAPPLALLLLADAAALLSASSSFISCKRLSNTALFFSMHRCSCSNCTAPIAAAAPAAVAGHRQTILSNDATAAQDAQTACTGTACMQAPRQGCTTSKSIIIVPAAWREPPLKEGTQVAALHALLRLSDTQLSSPSSAAQQPKQCC